MTVTIAPTGEFVMYAGVAAERWTGTLDDGSPVLMLVAAVARPNSLIGHTPLPPPANGWDPVTLCHMMRIWQLGGQLSSDDARELANTLERLLLERAADAKPMRVTGGQST